MTGKSSKKAIKLAKGITSRTGYAGGGPPITPQSLAANISPVEDNYDPDYNQEVLGQYLQGKFNRAVDLAKMPGDVLAGNRSFDPRSDADLADAFDLAGFAETGGMGGVRARAGDTVLGSGPMRQIITKTEPTHPVEMSHQIVDLLKQGRHKEITNEMLASADHPTLTKLYNEGATGEYMPMDYKSRMGRANEMGYDQKRYRGIRGDEAVNYSLNTDRAEGKMRGTGSWLSSDPDIAATYTGNRSESPATLPLLVQSKELKNIPWKGEVWSYGPKGKSTDEVGRAVRNVGVKGVNFNDIVDVGPHLWNRVDHMKRIPDTSTTTMVVDPSIVRSPFALFDPRLNHLTHLNRKDGGSVDNAVDVARKHYATGGNPFYGQEAYNQLMADIAGRKTNIPVGQFDLYKGAGTVPGAAKVPVSGGSDAPAKSASFDYQPARLYEDGGGNDYGNAEYIPSVPDVETDPSGVQIANTEKGVQQLEGTAPKGYFSDLMANPGTAIANTALNFALPELGPAGMAASLVNSGLGLYGGQQNTFAGRGLSLINSLSKDANAPTGIPSNVQNEYKGTPQPNAVLFNGPYGPVTQKDLDAAALVAHAEASNQGPAGQAAVVGVLGTRAQIGYQSGIQNKNSISAQAYAPGQFFASSRDPAAAARNLAAAKNVMNPNNMNPAAVAARDKAYSSASGVLSGNVAVPSEAQGKTDFNRAPISYNVNNGGVNADRLGAHTYFNASPQLAQQVAKVQNLTPPQPIPAPTINYAPAPQQTVPNSSSYIPTPPTKPAELSGVQPSTSSLTPFDKQDATTSRAQYELGRLNDASTRNQNVINSYQQMLQSTTSVDEKNNIMGEIKSAQQAQAEINAAIGNYQSQVNAQTPQAPAEQPAAPQVSTAPAVSPSISTDFSVAPKGDYSYNKYDENLLDRNNLLQTMAQPLGFAAKNPSQTEEIQTPIDIVDKMPGAKGLGFGPVTPTDPKTATLLEENQIFSPVLTVYGTNPSTGKAPQSTDYAGFKGPPSPVEQAQPTAPAPPASLSGFLGDQIPSSLTPVDTSKLGDKDIFGDRTNLGGFLGDQIPSGLTPVDTSKLGDNDIFGGKTDLGSFAPTETSAPAESNAPPGSAPPSGDITDNNINDSGLGGPPGNDTGNGPPGNDTGNGPSGNDNGNGPSGGDTGGGVGGGQGDGNGGMGERRGGFIRFKNHVRPNDAAVQKALKVASKYAKNKNKTIAKKFGVVK